MSFLLALLLVNSLVWAQSDCPSHMMRVWSATAGHACQPRLNHNQDPILCAGTPAQQKFFEDFPGPLYQSKIQPWWAYQGNVFFPNLHFPGAWTFPYVDSKYYAGEGSIFAAKPNVYVETIHAEKKFDFRFVSEEKLSFLVTTPPLDRGRGWKGKITGGDKFEIDGVFYEYLFYDIRLPKEKMQFHHGQCATREAAIEWMLNDLKAMNYSVLAIQDFEEHWRVKIPEYPFYCIYPQYNRQLDDVLPVGINLEQATFIRSLYVLVPLKKEPDVEDPSEIPFPSLDPARFRPSVKIKKEFMFREWGVAFLGQ